MHRFTFPGQGKGTNLEFCPGLLERNKFQALR